MEARAHFYTTFRFFTERENSAELEGSTVSEILQSLARKYPEAQKGLFDDNERLRDFFNIYVNGEDIRTLQGEDTAVSDGDEIILLPVIAGGAQTEKELAAENSAQAEKSAPLVPAERVKAAKLDDKDITRYGKHLLLREIGVKGQKRIRAARVLVVGGGALGSQVVLSLALAGVGTIALADPTAVTLENLQSQILYTSRDIDRPKTAAARDALKKLNPGVQFVPIAEPLDADTIADVVAEYDLVVDASDSFPMRYMLNDACVLAKKPCVFGALYQAEGYVTVYGWGSDAPCYRCQFPSPPPVGLTPTCSENGVISSLPATIGGIVAGEALKLIIGGGSHLAGRMLLADTWNMGFRTVGVRRRDSCPVCGPHPSIFKVESFDYQDFCGLKRDEGEEEVVGIEAKDLANRIASGEKITLIDVREPHERTIMKFPNAVAIPIGQLARRQKELDPGVDTVFICREGKRSILAINTLREAGYEGPMYNLKGGIEAARDVIFASDGAWL